MNSRLSSGYASSLIIVGLVLSQSLWAEKQTTWRWVDSEGKVTYGDHPPNGTVATRIRISTGTSNQEASTTDIPEDTQTAASGSSPHDVKAASQLAMNPEKSKALCLQARTNLVVLNEHAMIRQVDESGEKRILTEEEKQDQIKTAQNIIESYCP